MKNFFEMLKILEENKLQDLLQDRQFMTRARQDLGQFGSGVEDVPTTIGSLRPKMKHKIARYAGLPTERKDDRSKELTSNFEKLRYYLSTTGGELIQQLKNVRKKGMFPDLFPSKKDVLAGFTPEQVESLKVALKSHSSDSEESRTSRNPYHASLRGERMDKIRRMAYQERFRRAAAKVPFATRLEIAADTDNWNSDGWQGEIEPEDLVPGSSKYDMTIRHLKRKGYLGDSEETARELSYGWLKKNGYWED